MSYGGGLILGPSSSVSGDTPNALQLVQRVFTECRIAPLPTTLNPGTTNSNIVFEAFNDIQYELWRSERWPWRMRMAFIRLVADTPDYLLPADFDQLAVPPMIGSTAKLATYDLYDFVETFGMYDPLPTSGTPTSCALMGNAIRLYPPPSSDCLTAYPRMQVLYLRKPPARLTVAQETDSFDMPPEFIPVMVAWGRYVLKKALAYPDAQTDFQEYDRLRRFLIARTRKSPGPAKIRRNQPAVMSSEDF